MLTIVIVVVLIAGAIIIAGWLKKKNEIDKNKSDGTIHPK
jgi:flagellar basal body-associated protein FliL